MRLEHYDEKHFPYLRCFLIFCTISVLMLSVFFLASSRTFSSGSNAEPLYDWEYVSGPRLSSLGLWSSNWASSSRDHPVRPQGNGDYMLLRGILPNRAGLDTLCIRSANALLTVKSGGTVLYNTMDTDKRFSGSRIAIISLKDLSESRQVEITMYNPLAFGFDAYLTTATNAATATASSPYLDLILGVVFLCIGLILLLLLSVSLKRIVRRTSLHLIASIFVLCGLAVFANPSFTHLPRTVMTFKLSMFFQILVPTAALLAIFLGKLKWNSKIEGIIGIDILYAICVLFSPYDILSVYLIKCCTILQITNWIMFLYLVKKHHVNLSSTMVASYCAFMLGNVFYWYSISNQLLADFGLAMHLVAAGYAMVAFVGTVREELPAEALGDGVFNASVPEDLPPVYSPLFQRSIAALDDAVRTLTEVEKVRKLFSVQAEKSQLAQFPKEFNFYDAIRRLVVEKCDGTTHHLLHVAAYVHTICLKLGLSEEKADFVARASLLHDIGKISVPHEILFKIDSLTEREFQQIRRHTLYGYNMLSGCNNEFLNLAAQIAYEHHERYDGSGYNGSSGDAINFYARITAIADVFDALTGERGYKKVWTFDQAIGYIRDHGGDFFDPELSEVFVSCYDDLLSIYKDFQAQKTMERQEIA